MKTKDLTQTLNTLFSELIDGAVQGEAYMLNPGDPGLCNSLEQLSAEAASRSVGGRASIAAHVDHLRYGFALMNRWAASGENPFADADWTASWERSEVSEEEWSARRAELRKEMDLWRSALSIAREVNQTELNGMISSIAHLAYHFGAIRQIDYSLRGPQAND